jgi:hypothetical protein
MEEGLEERGLFGSLDSAILFSEMVWGRLVLSGVDWSTELSVRDDQETKQLVRSLSVSARGGLVNSMRDFSDGSYLVDPASSHMLVSKIKPCMS